MKSEMKGESVVQKAKELQGLEKGPLFSFCGSDRQLIGYEYVCPQVYKSCKYDCPNRDKPCEQHDRRCGAITRISGLKPLPMRCVQCNNTIDIIGMATPAIHAERLRKAKPSTEEGKKALLSKPITAEEMRWFASQLPMGNSPIPFLEDNLPPGISRRDGPRVVFDQGLVGIVYEPGDPERTGDPGNYALGDPAQ